MHNEKANHACAAFEALIKVIRVVLCEVVLCEIECVNCCELTQKPSKTASLKC
jgi:hypothetical protein